MSFTSIAILVISISLYLFVVIKTIKRINNYVGFNNIQKRINIIFTLIFSIIWAPFIYSLTKPDPTITALKKMRDKDKKELHFGDSTITNNL
jgi:hypothetical protein